MLFFNKKKKADATNLDKKYIQFLSEVDAEYMRAFSTKSMRVLKNYLSRECAVELSSIIFAAGSRYFGADKFRTTQWTLLSSDNNVLTILKDVTFDKVKVAGSLYIEVADNYKEVWQLDVNQKDFVICDIIPYKRYSEMIGSLA